MYIYTHQHKHTHTSIPMLENLLEECTDNSLLFTLPTTFTQAQAIELEVWFKR
jgi:hypothetical protein